MGRLFRRPKHPKVITIACLATLPAWVLGVGFIFHTSFDATVLGKYSTGYFVFLCLWFLLAVPASFLLASFVFGTQHLKLSGGRTFAVRPRDKIAWGLFVILPTVVIADQVLTHRVRKHTASVSTDAFHPFLQNAPKPGRSRYNINRWGFRGEDIEKAKPADTFRVFVIGGSTVFCGRSDFEDTHCRILETELRRIYPDRVIEVQNAGVEWHCTEHATIKYLFHIQDFDPDLVIVFHGINDLLRSLSPDQFAEGKYRSDYGHYYGPVANYVRPRFTVFSLFTQHFDYWFSDFRKSRVRLDGPYGEGVRGARMYLFPKTEPVEIDDWPSIKAFERNLRDLINIIQSRGIKVIVGSQPYLYRDDLSDEDKQVIWFAQSHHDDGTRPSLASMRRGMEAFNATTARVAAETYTTFADLDAAVPKTTEYLYDDVHYTRKGNEAVAFALRDVIVEKKLIGEGDGGE